MTTEWNGERQMGARYANSWQFVFVIIAAVNIQTFVKFMLTLFTEMRIWCHNIPHYFLLRWFTKMTEPAVRWSVVSSRSHKRPSCRSSPVSSATRLQHTAPRCNVVVYNMTAIRRMLSLCDMVSQCESLMLGTEERILLTTQAFNDYMYVPGLAIQMSN